jgi:hypothetical protein
MTGIDAWVHPVAWSAVRGGGGPLRLVAGPKIRARVARDLQLEEVKSLKADLYLRPWRDGMEIAGKVQAVVTRVCGVSLDTFDEVIDEPMLVRVLPRASPHAPAGDEREVIVDLAADDPPDVAGGESVDVGAYVVEALGLALDPFARKPGAIFEAPPDAGPLSPFAALDRLRRKPAAD